MPAEAVKALTFQAFRSIVSAIFRKGTSLMTRYGFGSTMMIANNVKHVRTIVVYDHQKVREA